MGKQHTEQEYDALQGTQQLLRLREKRGKKFLPELLIFKVIATPMIRHSLLCFLYLERPTLLAFAFSI